MAFGLLAAASVASASDVTQLKKDSFDTFVKENDIVLAECKLPTALPPPQAGDLYCHPKN